MGDSGWAEEEELRGRKGLLPTLRVKTEREGDWGQRGDGM